MCSVFIVYLQRHSKNSICYGRGQKRLEMRYKLYIFKLIYSLLKIYVIIHAVLQDKIQKQDIICSQIF